MFPQIVGLSDIFQPDRM